MWRTFFLAVGVFLCILGAQCLAVDKFVLKGSEADARTDLLTGQKTVVHREISPPEWVPWSFLSSGAITCIYSFTLRRGGGK
jgi:hypothetical protein